MSDASILTDADRLRFVMQEIDGFVGVEADKHDYAMQVANERGNDEPTPDDELDGIRLLIDATIRQGASND